MSAPDFRKQVIDVIPMAFLIRNDVPGATGPTEQCDVVQAVRDLTASGRRAVNRCLAAEAMRDALLEALERLLEHPGTHHSNCIHWQTVGCDCEYSEVANAARAAIAKARGQ